MKYPKIIAEIGCNHKGDMEIAKKIMNQYFEQKRNKK